MNNFLNLHIGYGHIILPSTLLFEIAKSKNLFSPSKNLTVINLGLKVKI